MKYLIILLLLSSCYGGNTPVEPKLPGATIKDISQYGGYQSIILNYNDTIDGNIYRVYVQYPHGGVFVLKLGTITK